MSEIPLEVTRKRLLDQVFDAYTHSEIALAREALRDWIHTHPDEPGMADAFEVLSHQEDMADERETHPEVQKTAATGRSK